MLAREYNKRISIYESVTAEDGFGGNIPDSLIPLGKSWAKLITNSSSIQVRTTALGITELNEPLLFKLRYRNDLFYQGRTYFLTYNDNMYIIKNITDVDQFHREIEIMCTKSIAENLPVITT